jgi:ribonuclease BN (tRNA processing enzyme)
MRWPQWWQRDVQSPSRRRGGGGVLLVVLAVAVPAAAGQARPPGAGDLPVRIVLLGTGTPNATPDRMGPASAIVVGDTPYLVDMGPGIVRRAAAAAALGVEALRVSNLGHVFVTHLHSDHTAGYADLILTPWVLERTRPLEAYGPPGLAAMTRHLLAAYREDIAVRLHGLEPANPTGYRVRVHEVKPGVVFRDVRAGVTVEAFAVPHGSWRYAYGYKFVTPAGVVVISGDTGPFDGLAAIARGADVLVHEAYATEGWKRRDPVWQRYHAAFHTPGWKVGEIAARAGVATVILTHQLTWSASDAELVAEVQRTFGGRVVSGRDLDVFDLRAVGHRADASTPGGVGGAGARPPQ